MLRSNDCTKSKWEFSLKNILKILFFRINELFQSYPTIQNDSDWFLSWLMKLNEVKYTVECVHMNFDGVKMVNRLVKHTESVF